MKIFNKLCPPAKFYLIIASISFMFLLFQNVGSSEFTLGVYSCPHPNPGGILFVNAIYIVFMTWLLNWICKVNTNISWVIVLFPFLIMFIALGIVLIKGREGMCASCGQFSIPLTGECKNPPRTKFSVPMLGPCRNPPYT